MAEATNGDFTIADSLSVENQNKESNNCNISATNFKDPKKSSKKRQSEEGSNPATKKLRKPDSYNQKKSAYKFSSPQKTFTTQNLKGQLSRAQPSSQSVKSASVKAPQTTEATKSIEKADSSKLNEDHRTTELLESTKSETTQPEIIIQLKDENISSDKVKFMELPEQNNCLDNPKTAEFSGSSESQTNAPSITNDENKSDIESSKILKCMEPPQQIDGLGDCKLAESSGTGKSGIVAVPEKKPKQHQDNTTEAKCGKPEFKKPCRILKLGVQRSATELDLKGYKYGNKGCEPTQCLNVCSQEAAMSSGSSLEVASIMTANKACYYVVENSNPKSASLRIFSTIMLNAWRKRRTQVKQLTSEIEELKRATIKNKNQLHVYNTLFRMEKQRNEKLSLELKNSKENANFHKSSCEQLTTTILECERDKKALEDLIQQKEQQYQDVSMVLEVSKLDLLKVMQNHCGLQEQLSIVRGNLKETETQQMELTVQIDIVKNTMRDKQALVIEELLRKFQEVLDATTEIKTIEDKIDNMKDKEYLFRDYSPGEAELKNQIDVLQSEVDALQNCLAATLGNRLKKYWYDSLVYQKAAFGMLHLAAFYVLPATPPPSKLPKITLFPIGLTLKKAMGIIKR